MAEPRAMRAIAATYLPLPQTPMIFMGEEWGATQPFPFFCDFDGDLAHAVREGRRGEFAGFPEFQDPEQRDRIPDPLAASTFESAKLDWDDLARAPHAEWLAWYRRVLTTRRQTLTPLLRGIRAGGCSRVVSPGAVTVSWPLGESRESLMLSANLSEGSWTVRWSIEPASA